MWPLSIVSNIFFLFANNKQKDLEPVISTENREINKEVFSFHFDKMSNLDEKNPLLEYMIWDPEKNNEVALSVRKCIVKQAQFLYERFLEAKKVSLTKEIESSLKFTALMVVLKANEEEPHLDSSDFLDYLKEKSFQITITKINMMEKLFLKGIDYNLHLTKEVH